jgi:hypothetical protein
MATYPHERQIEYWVSRAIEDYFENEGYDIVVLPNSPRAEKALPYDHLFAGRGIKIFGLQYKRLHNGKQDYWLIDIGQFQQLSKFDWIYYALPQITSIHQHRNALHLLAITTSASMKNKIGLATSPSYQLLQSDLGVGRSKVPYFRWGGFVQKLFACTEGWHPNTAEELRSILRDADALFNTLIDLYIVPLSTKLAIRLSPFVTDIQDIEPNYDFGIELR